MSHLRSLAAAGVLAIAACADNPVTPISSLTPVASTASSVQSRKHIVSFKTDAIPTDFESRISALGGAVEASYDGVGVGVVSGLSDAAAASLAGSGDVSEIALDQEFQILDPNFATQVEAVSVVPASQADPAAATRFARQWNMRQIGADGAWAAGKLGSPTVKVAILDTGIDYLFPDLVGLVDLQNSASFVPTDDALVAAFFPGRNVVTDLHLHGTHVAQVVSSNALILAGVTSRTTLMAVKVLGVSGGGSISSTLAGIVFATDHGANVINMSLGDASLPYDMKDKALKDFFIKVVERGFKYAHSKDVTVVVAAGNEAQDLAQKQTYKPFCGATHSICVSATGPTSSSGVNGPWANIDAFASYSNFGLKRIDVAAPGGNFGGLVWGGCSTSSLVQPVCRTGIFIIGLAGTSQATPHTSGLAALLAAENGGAGSIRSSIENTADDLGDNGQDALFGRGRINVARAVGLQ